MTGPLRLGTRGSPLALAQTAEVARLLAAAHPGLALETVVIRTTGDRVQDRPLAEIGGKGLFTKELEEALAEHRIDLAVHSMKDVPTIVPPGLAIAAILARADPRDAWFGRDGLALADLAPGAAIGTASLRRQAQLLALRPDLRVVPLRGNVGTRLDKLAAGAVDATVLAVAGLVRLGQAARIARILEPTEMLPAAGQGAIGIQTRADDGATRALLAPLHAADTGHAVTAERAVLDVLEGNCRTPFAALATPQDGGQLALEALVATPDGTRLERARISGAASDAARLGTTLGQQLRTVALAFGVTG